jgi:transcriptional regulator with XRE-family HTH domain
MGIARRRGRPRTRFITGTSNHQEVERRGRPRKWAEIPLAAWMISSGIRAEDLADRLGVDHSTVYRWFRGEQNPTRTTAKAIAEIARSSGRKLSLEDIFNPFPNYYFSQTPRRSVGDSSESRSREPAGRSCRDRELHGHERSRSSLPPR